MRLTVKLFKALSDSNRIRILKMLEARPLCVCEMTAVLNLATSTVSKHLSILRDASLIIDEKDGKWVNYRLNLNSPDLKINQLSLMIKDWLADDPTVFADAELVKKVNRETICGI